MELVPNEGFSNETVHQTHGRMGPRKRAGSQPHAERPVPQGAPKASFLRKAPPPISDHPPPPPPSPPEGPPLLPKEAESVLDLREEAEQEETARKMEEEIAKKRRQLQEVFKQKEFLGKESEERKHVLGALDRILPEIVSEYDRLFNPKARSERLAAVEEFERNLKASGEEGLIARKSRRDAKEKYLQQVGVEQQKLREKEVEWIKQLIEPFEQFRRGKDFDPVERLLHEYMLPEFLKKALWLNKGGSQPVYSEDGFANANGAPNYTRILQRNGLINLRPGFRGRKASVNDYEPELSSDEKLYGPLLDRIPVDWGTWWSKIGGFDPLHPEETDKNGWTALHHACDSGFSKRAHLAALEILDGRHFRGAMKLKMERALNLRTTGSQPNGYTALHLACDGQSRDCDNVRLVEALIARRADIECKDSLGNTPLLKAAGQGLANVCEYLIAEGADRTATDDNGAGAAQKAKTFISLKNRLVHVFKVPMTHVEPRQKQRHVGGDSASRTVRREFGQAHAAATNKPIGKGGTGDVVQNLYGCWRKNERLTAKGPRPYWEGRRGSSEDQSGSWKSWESWDEHHHYGHGSKGSSSWSWNQNGGDWRSW